MLFSVAMHQAYVREYYESEDKGLLLKLCIIPGTISFLTFSVVIIFSPFSLSAMMFGEKIIGLDWLVLGGLLISFLTNILTHVLRMQGRGMVFSITEALPKIIHLMAVALIFLVFSGYSYYDLIVSNFIALFSTLIFILYAVKDDIKKAITSVYDNEKMKSMLIFSLPLVVGGLSYWALTTLDRFFLRALSGFDELGLYAVTLSIASAATVLATIFSTMWHPIVYRWMSEGIQIEKIQSVIDYTLISVLTIWSFVGMFSWVINYLLPSEYYEAKFILVACIAMPLLYMLSEATVVGVGITRRSVFSMFASVAALTVNLVLNYLMIPEYGAAGAAVASALAFALFFAIRTESSCYVWKSVRRRKIYILLSLYLIITVIFALQIFEDRGSFVILWAAMQLLTLGLYSDRAKHVLSVINERFKIN